jgi:hypothetical protein
MHLIFSVVQLFVLAIIIYLTIFKPWKSKKIIKTPADQS